MIKGLIKFYQKIPNKLIAIFVFVIGFIVISFIFYYFLFSNKGNLILKGNIGGYKIDLYNMNTQVNFQHECENKDCKLVDLYSFKYELTISKEGYKKFKKQIEILKLEDLEVSFNLEKELVIKEILEEEKTHDEKNNNSDKKEIEKNFSGNLDVASSGNNLNENDNTGTNTGIADNTENDNIGTNTGTADNTENDNTGTNTGTADNAENDNTGTNTGIADNTENDNTGTNTGTADNTGNDNTGTNTGIADNTENDNTGTNTGTADNTENNNTGITDTEENDTNFEFNKNNTLKNQYKSFNIGKLGDFYFRDNGDETITLFNFKGKINKKLYIFKKIDKTKINIEPVYQTDNEILITLSDNKYFFDLTSYKIIGNVFFPQNIEYIKKNNGLYNFVTDKGTFIVDIKNDKKPYFFYLFKDFINFDTENYFGIIFSGEDEKIKNYNLGKTDDNYIVKYNFNTKKIKILEKTKLEVNKIIKEEKDVYFYTTDGKKYLINNIGE